MAGQAQSLYSATPNIHYMSDESDLAYADVLDACETHLSDDTRRCYAAASSYAELRECAARHQPNTSGSDFEVWAQQSPVEAEQYSDRRYQRWIAHHGITLDAREDRDACVANPNDPACRSACDSGFASACATIGNWAGLDGEFLSERTRACVLSRVYQLWDYVFALDAPVKDRERRDGAYMCTNLTNTEITRTSFEQALRKCMAGYEADGPLTCRNLQRAAPDWGAEYAVQEAVDSGCAWSDSTFRAMSHGLCD